MLNYTIFWMYHYILSGLAYALFVIIKHVLKNFLTPIYYYFCG